MSDAKNLKQAQQVYNTICSALDERNWHYTKHEKDLVVTFTVRGDDLPMEFVMYAEINSQLIRLVSRLPVKMSESKRVEGAIAVCAASYGMVDGSFEYDISDGEITYVLNATFRDSLIGHDLIIYMISCAGAMVDKYNDLFLMLNKDMISIADFIEKAK